MTEQEHEYGRWRTLIHVVEIDETDPENKVLKVILPGWEPEVEVNFPLSLVPEELLKDLKPDSYLLAAVSLDAEKPEDLKPANFEFAPDPVSEDDLS